jgi:hypothetical protein
MLDRPDPSPSHFFASSFEAAPNSGPRKRRMMERSIIVTT